MAYALHLVSGECLETWLEVIKGRLTSQSGGDAERIVSTRLLVWVCKAVVMRGHRDEKFYIDQVIVVLRCSHLK